jgi:hypothetical protein
MRKRGLLFLLLLGLLAATLASTVACVSKNSETLPDNSGNVSRIPNTRRPQIASWLAKKDELIESGKRFDLVMSGWFTPKEAEQIREQNPKAKLLAGLSVSFVWANRDWMTFLETVASYDRAQPLKIEECMYLRTPTGEKCPFGWASSEWGHEEIYAVDPRNEDWQELITSFYKVLLDQEQHDGIIVDMVTEKPSYWWPQAISDEEWVSATKSIMSKIQGYNTKGKLVIFNAGKELADIDAYGAFMDGYVMENFLGGWGANYDSGLAAADGPYLVVYAVDTNDTGRQDMKKMRLGLTLSLLRDNTYFAYDFGPRDHGQAWWFSEYDEDLGQPLGDYYVQDNAYRRDFEKGVVISSPKVMADVVFEQSHVDVSSGVSSLTFSVEAGDGRIFLRSEP